MSVIEKLGRVQTNLKAPKEQYNSFGKYNYRSCEDILEAVKPLLQEVKSAIIVSDDVVLIGERYYIKATATFYDDKGETVSNSAFAREPIDKKGMDVSQITGTASSYARKYALNGLLLIDDTKDADTDEHRNETTTKPAYTGKEVSVGGIPLQNLERIKAWLKKEKVSEAKVAKEIGIKTLDDMTGEMWSAWSEKYKEARDGK